MDPIEIEERLRGRAEGQPEVDMHGQAEGHDIGIKLPELQGGGVPGKRVEVHAEEVDVEGPVDVMQLVEVLPEG